MRALTKPIPALALSATAALLAATTACRSNTSGAPAPDVVGATDAAHEALERTMDELADDHARLWRAGTAGDWKQVDTEIGRIEFGFDTVRREHPRIGAHELSTAKALDSFTVAPRFALRAAVAAHDDAGFRESFDALSAACNTCHEAYGRRGDPIGRPR